MGVDEALDGAFRSWWRGVRDEIDAIDRWDVEHAPRFNLFQVLKAERDEVRTHSRLLAALLDPHGTHGQGGRFLRAFLEHPDLAEFRPNASDDESAGRWTVAVEEAHGDYGRFDLVIRCPDERLLIAIENKIDAGEQERQCDRYLDWLEAQTGWRSRFIFLTPDGRRAGSVTGDRNYTALSYETVAKLLKPTTTSDPPLPPHVNFAVEQYLYLAHWMDTWDLGGLLMAREERLADFLNRTENLENAFLVAEAVNLVRQRRLKAFFELIEEEAIRIADDGWQGKIEFYSPHSDLYLYEQDGDRLYVSAQVGWGQLTLGISWSEERAHGDLEPQAVAGLRDAARKILGDIPDPTGWWLARRTETMALEEIYRASESRARELGRILGELLRETGPAIQRANRELAAKRKG